MRPETFGLCLSELGLDNGMIQCGGKIVIIDSLVSSCDELLKCWNLLHCDETFLMNSYLLIPQLQSAVKVSN